MKTIETHNSSTTEESQIISHTNNTAKGLTNLIGNNFSTRIQDHWEE